MDAHTLYMTVKEHGTLAMMAIVLVMTLIQITPIKINPWSKLARGIAKLFTGDVTRKLDALVGISTHNYNKELKDDDNEAFYG